MSRIGRLPVEIPAGVKVSLEGKTITVKGSKGELTHTIPDCINAAVEGNQIVITRENELKETKALHGLTRALVNNMVIGVTNGYRKELEISEGGYRAQKRGKELVLNLGYSHDVIFVEEDGITFEVENPNKIAVVGIDKQRVGQIASEIRGKRPPEPYLGKGVRYAGEVIRRKTGKAGK